MTGRRLRYELVRRLGAPLAVRGSRLRRLAARALRRLRGDAPTKRGPFGPPLESTRRLREIMASHYLSGRFAEGAVPVAWVTSGFPVEFLRPFGFFVLYPENHAALCAAKRLVPELSLAVEREGYSRDLCGYARCDLGCLATARTPVGRLPRPDLLCCCTNICQTVLGWYRALAHRLRVPLVIVDTPFVYGSASPGQLAYVREQLGELCEVAGRVSGRRNDEARTRRVLDLSLEGTRLWDACLRTAVARPAPWTAFDAFVHMAPIVSLRGTEECNAYYRLLLDELRERVRRGIGGIASERARLLWDNLPIWYELRPLATLLAQRGFSVVCATYTNAWAEAGSLIDPRDPVGSAAFAYSHIILNVDLPTRLGTMERLCAEYGVDGAILHSDRSCKPYSVGQIDLRDRLARDLGIRTLLLEADHADQRSSSWEQLETRVTAFMESFGRPG